MAVSPSWVLLRRVGVCGAAGAALFEGRLLATPDRFEAIAREGRFFGTQAEVSVALTPTRWVVAMGITGALFGAAVPFSSKLLHRRGIVPGAVHGVMAYVVTEAAFRVAASARTERWAHDPGRSVPRLAAIGALLGWVDALATGR